MKLLFSIGGVPEVKSPQPVLSLRIGPAHICFSVSDLQTNQLHQLAYYSAEKNEHDLLRQLVSIHPEIKGEFYQVLIGFDFPSTCLVPSNCAASEPGKNLISVMYGMQPDLHFHSEQTADPGIWNIYAIPAGVYRELDTMFSRAKYWQQSTIDSLNAKNSGDEGAIQIVFRPDSFSVYVTRNSNVLLVQTYAYSTAPEVLYHLLSICGHFNFDQAKVSLRISGLIDSESALYREISQYFINIEFRVVNWKEANRTTPAHFFTPLNDLAACAS